MLPMKSTDISLVDLRCPEYIFWDGQHWTAYCGSHR